MELITGQNNGTRLTARILEMFGGSRESDLPISPKEFRISMAMLSGAFGIAALVFQLARR